MVLEEYHQGKQGKYLNKYKTSKIEKLGIESGITLVKACRCNLLAAATCLLLQLACCCFSPFIKQTE